MNRLCFLKIAISAILWGCVPTGQSSVSTYGPRRLVLADKTYEPAMRTVRIFQSGQTPLSQLSPAVTRMGEWNLVLEFDDLHPSHETYNFRLIHCNQNWTKSTLSDLDFLFDFNEFPINNFEFSVDTWIPYVHYWTMLPPVKLPGNYVVVVYRGGDKDDIVLSKRFMVFDQRVAFFRDGNLMTSGTTAVRNQQLNFTVNYRNLQLINPIETIYVTIRQNERWDNIAQEIKPSFLREDVQEIEYRFLSDEDMFRGGNEFRFFDLRSLQNPGRNVSHMDRSKVPWTAFIDRDKSRSGEAYSQYEDFNGNYFIDNYDYRRLSFANYANVVFTLSSPQPVPGDVHVAGAFTQWAMDDTSLMRYDSVKREYTATFLLKQGWYDYQYAVKANGLPYYHFEGSHFQTENTYEIFVYYRSLLPLADLLIGYIRFEQNARIR